MSTWEPTWPPIGRLWGAAGAVFSFLLGLLGAPWAAVGVAQAALGGTQEPSRLPVGALSVSRGRKRRKRIKMRIVRFA